MRPKLNSYLLLALFFVTATVLLPSCTSINKRKEAVRWKEVRVECYPGPAEVSVNGVPEAKTTTPGILRLQRPEVHWNLTGALPKGVYEISFAVNGRPLKTAYVRWLYSELSTVGWYKTYISSGFKTSSVDRFTPDDIYVIDKDAAIKKGDVAPVVRGLKSKVDWVREDAADALGLMGSAEALEPLITTSRDMDPAVRAAAVRSLGRLGGPKALEVVGVALNDPEPDVCVEAAIALERMGDTRGRSQVLAKARSATPSMRVGFVEACAKRTWEGGRDVIVQALGDTESMVQEAALRSLIKTGGETAIEPVIAKVVATSDDLDVQLLAAECLWKIGQETAISSLVQALNDNDPVKRQRAAFALGRLGRMSTSAVPSLIDVLEPGQHILLKASREYEVSPQLNDDATTPPGVQMTVAAVERYQSPEMMGKMIAEKWRLGYSPSASNLGIEAAAGFLRYALVDAPREEAERRKEEQRLRERIESICVEELGDLLRHPFDPSDTTTHVVATRKIADLDLPAGLLKWIEHTPSADSTATSLPKTCVAKECTSTVGDGIVDVDVVLEMNPVVYALGQITGRDYGDDRDAWREWSEEHR